MSSRVDGVPFLLPELVDVIADASVSFLELETDVVGDALALRSGVGESVCSLITRYSNVAWDPDKRDLAVDAVKEVHQFSEEVWSTA